MRAALWFAAACTCSSVTLAEGSRTPCNEDDGEGQCADGYVTDIGETKCVEISSLTLDAFNAECSTPWDRDDSNEADARLANFKNNAQAISEHNAECPTPSIWSLNCLSAHSDDEYSQINGARLAPPSATYKMRPSDVDDENPPASIDWVAKGAVTSVKNQGLCHCCYSISTVGAIEGIVAIQSNFTFLESLSFQEIISCDTTNKGCGGGNIYSAMDWAQTNQFQGLSTDKNYPFVSKDKTVPTCDMSSRMVAVKSEEPFKVTTSGSGPCEDRVDAIKKAVAKQPVSIWVKAKCPDMQHYKGGVMTKDGACACNSTISPCVDHAVLIVGYNDTDAIPNWKIKNSWGTGWGEEGYIRVSQNCENTGDWGLLGMLSEGIIPSGGYNITVEVPYTGKATSASYGKYQLASVVATIFVLLA